MKLLLVTVGLVLLSASCGACSTGAVTKDSAQHNSAPTSGKPTLPMEIFKPNTFDGDDNPVRFFGREAEGTTRRAIVSLVTRYYRVAAMEDGRKACALVDPIALEAVLENYEQTSMSGAKACGVTLSKLFKQRHQALVSKNAKLAIESVRVHGRTALALLRFLRFVLPNRITLRRERATWKMWELFDTSMP